MNVGATPPWSLRQNESARTRPCKAHRPAGAHSLAIQSVVGSSVAFRVPLASVYVRQGCASCLPFAMLSSEERAKRLQRSTNGLPAATPVLIHTHLVWR